jgi:spermidine synthase
VLLLAGLALSLERAWVPAAHSAILFRDESPYQYVTVTEAEDGTRALIYDAGFGVQSVKPPGLYADGYWDFFAALPLYITPQDGTFDVLVLGSAASATERQMARFWPEERFSFTSVEIDPVVVSAAETFFDPPEREVVVEDARTFVASAAREYDIILVDAYSREITVPFHLTTTEFFAQLEKRLAPGGVIGLNINAGSREGMYIRSIVATLRRSVPRVEVISLSNSCNHLVLGSRELLTEVRPATGAVIPLLPVLQSAATVGESDLILTDNHAPTELLGLSALCGLF